MMYIRIQFDENLINEIKPMQNYLSTETKVVLFKKTAERLFLVSPHSTNYWKFQNKKNGFITFVSKSNSLTFHENSNYYWLTVKEYEIFKT